MKSFDEFLKALDSDKIALDTFNSACMQEDDLQAISQSSQTYCLELLRAYHEWLTTEFLSNDK